MQYTVLTIIQNKILQSADIKLFTVALKYKIAAHYLI